MLLMDWGSSCLLIIMAFQTGKDQYDYIEPFYGTSGSCIVAANSLNNSFQFEFGNENTLKFTSNICSEDRCDASLPGM